MKLLQSIKEKHEAAIAESRAAFHQECQSVFTQFPAVKSFGWRQYTDYFNDGDECHFYVREYTLKINGEQEYENTDALEKEVTYLTSLIQTLPSDVMKSMFGDHVEITVSPEGVQVDEYSSHD